LLECDDTKREGGKKEKMYGVQLHIVYLCVTGTDNKRMKICISLAQPPKLCL